MYSLAVRSKADGTVRPQPYCSILDRCESSCRFNIRFLQSMKLLKSSLPFAAAVLAGLLLFFSFAPFDIALCGWIALVPLMLACAGKPLRRAAQLGWLAGVAFFLTSLFWLRHVTWAGTLALVVYCALYFIPFALFVALRRDGWRSTNGLKNLLWMAGASAVWVASEYLRSMVITGFPWNLLGVSQYRQLPLIQIAEWGGVYAVSGLMVFVNAATAVTLLQYAVRLRGPTYRVHLELMAALLLTAAAWSLGFHTLLNRPAAEGAPLRVALIQPNIPEVGNWELADPELIYERLETLTDLAIRSPGLDLVIWPETALPDFVRFSPRSAGLVEQFASAAGVPLLTGSMDVLWQTDAPPLYYNASILFNPRGELLGSYYKQHLVLFGEYIPFDHKIDWINALTPIPSSFHPGTDASILRLPGDPRGFGVLICFEDTLPYLARRAARAGACWLVNQTNDSWFDPGSGSVQHLANAVFRSVETRLPMVRCTNTGVTCEIDPFGRIQQTLAPRVQGFQIATVVPVSPQRDATFYVRHGDRFAQACLAASVALYLALFIRKPKKTHG
jgi:apolipoprotein N-acyltransferase